MNCKKCNSPLEEGTVFCPNCGQRVEEDIIVETPVVEPQITESVPVSNATIEKKGNSNLPLIIIIIVLGVLLLGTIMFTLFKYVIPEVTEKQTPTPVVTPDIKDDNKDDEKNKGNEVVEDTMVIGDTTLGYLKLPGTWIKGKVAGSADSSLQYFTYSGGKYIVTLDVLDKTKYTDAKSTATIFEYSYKSDSDATNISTIPTKVGKYDAYLIKVQYKSDSVWVYSYFFKAEDGLIHMIQTEGLDTTSKNFTVQDTFSLTKTN